MMYDDVDPGDLFSCEQLGPLEFDLSILATYKELYKSSNFTDFCRTISLIDEKFYPSLIKLIETNDFNEEIYNSLPSGQIPTRKIKSHDLRGDFKENLCPPPIQPSEQIGIPVFMEQPIKNFLLFKIDEKYKLLNTCNIDAIKLHQRVYTDVIYEELHLNQFINKLQITDEYGFFENEIYDIDVIKSTLVEMSNAINNFSKIFNPKIFTKQDISLNKNINNIVTPNKKKTHFEGVNINGRLYKNAKKKVQKIYTYVFFNKFFLNITILKDTNLNLDDINNFFPELVLIDKLEINEINVYNQLYNEIKNISDENELKQKIKLIMNNFNEEKEWPERPTFDAIKSYINLTYNITTSLEDRIQFNDIFQNLVKSMKYYNENDRALAHKLLPLVLKDLGLNKKRYSQGVFWFGLIVKPIDDTKNEIFGFKLTEENKYQPILNEKVTAISTDEFNNMMEQYNNKRNELDTTMETYFEQYGKTQEERLVYFNKLFDSNELIAEQEEYEEVDNFKSNQSLIHMMVIHSMPNPIPVPMTYPDENMNPTGINKHMCC